MLRPMPSSSLPAGPTVLLRPVTDADADDVLALNEHEVEMLAPMDEDRFHAMRQSAHRFDVVQVDGTFGGFVITFAPGADHDSENYRWFSERSGGGDDFYYLDRFVLHESQRRRGIGGRVYDDVESVAAGYGRLALEVNLVPRNEASLAFHASRGYVEVGQLGDPQHLVSLMEKAL